MSRISMLMLLFWVGAERWAIATSEIKDVLPLVNLQPAANSHCALSGWLNYRGDMVQTLDISKLLSGKAAPAVMGTRIVVIEIADERIGLIVERVEKTVRFSDRDESLRSAPYAQAVIKDHGEVVQQLSLSAVAEQLARSPSSQLPSPQLPSSQSHLSEAH